MPSTRRADLAAVALACLLPTAGLSQQLADGTPIHADDGRRLAEYHAAAGEALLDAFSGGDPADLATLAGVLRGDPLPPEGARAVMPGDWSCRVIKMGRLLPITVYQPFRCRIGSDGSLEKLTGSQRTKGQIHQDGERLVYLGTGFIAGDTPPPYADLPPFSAGSDPQRVPELGVVEMIDENRGRVMFPDPHLESRFNVLALSR
ncbi:DUF4893 domain-containing protein [Paracoccus benzoatiresistens]|uniref:DUF4893 domain-containing protein n=1 Tax=Paracoccus benzoatiresistens TaxID=2997341 RepID=A0ABT4J3E8_9RHOB|nr:DUF4893 domain-containing protein [Paracoccus sp. EF6]MCZ0961665.1 DUF4893 domain-containing protein [Paracoccus sp. EF6]